MEKELNEDDIKRQDLVDNAIFDMLLHVIPKTQKWNGTSKQLQQFATKLSIGWLNN